MGTDAISTVSVPTKVRTVRFVRGTLYGRSTDTYGTRDRVIPAQGVSVARISAPKRLKRAIENYTNTECYRRREESVSVNPSGSNRSGLRHPLILYGLLCTRIACSKRVDACTLYNNHVSIVACDIRLCAAACVYTPCVSRRDARLTCVLHRVPVPCVVHDVSRHTSGLTENRGFFSGCINWFFFCAFLFIGQI